MTTAIKSLQMRSGDDHCEQALADVVRRRSLQSRTGRHCDFSEGGEGEEEKEEKEEEDEEEEKEEEPRI